MSTLELKELSHPAGEVIKIAAGKTLDLNSQGSVTMPTGSVLQVVSTKNTSATTINSTSFQTTNMELAITPLATSSKILIMITSSVGGDDVASAYLYGGIFRGSTELFEMLGQREHNESAFGGGMSMTYLDSPSTTSATTYKFMGRATATGMDFRFNYNGGQSTITLMEIAG